MLYIPKKEMNINKFVDTKLPTKREIFARTGGVSVSPAGSYTGDESADIGLSKTEKAEKFVKAAEAFKNPKDNAEK